MADLSYINRNNEQRANLSSVGKLQALMPGEQVLEEGVQHTIGAIPQGALLKGWTANTEKGWNVVVALGTAANPILFATALNVSSSNVNDKALPFEFYFPEGEDIVCTLTSNNTVDGGLFQFTLDYTEVNTTVGAYTA